MQGQLRDDDGSRAIAAEQGHGRQPAFGRASPKEGKLVEGRETTLAESEKEKDPWQSSQNLMRFVRRPNKRIH
jgi:hypothetical protein